MGSPRTVVLPSSYASEAHQEVHDHISASLPTSHETQIFVVREPSLVDSGNVDK